MPTKFEEILAQERALIEGGRRGDEDEAVVDGEAGGGGGGGEVARDEDEEAAAVVGGVVEDDEEQEREEEEDVPLMGGNDEDEDEDEGGGCYHDDEGSSSDVEGRLLAIVAGGLVAIAAVVGALRGLFPSTGRPASSASTRHRPPSSLPRPSSLTWSSPLFDDGGRYRRVCAIVRSSELCMVLRYPFNVSYPSLSIDGGPNGKESHLPDDPSKFHGLRGAVLLDGTDLARCIYGGDAAAAGGAAGAGGGGGGSATIASRVVRCLDGAAEARGDDDDVALGLFTRKKLATAKDAGGGVRTSFGKRKKDGEEHIYSTRTASQRARATDYFGGHIVLIVGSGTVRGIFEGLSSSSRDGGKTGGGIFRNCVDIPGGPAKLSEDLSVKCDGGVLVYKFDYYPEGNVVDMMDFADALGVFASNAQRDWRTTWKLSVLVDFPLAETQCEDDLLGAMDQVRTFQEQFARKIIDANGTEQRQKLAEIGFDLRRLIVFDGMPQHWPTVTGSDHEGWYPATFSSKGWYEGWDPKLHGHSCVGPIPSWSQLSVANGFERRAFEDDPTFDDANYYGRTYDFVNEFWWQHLGWAGREGLDCVSYKTGSAANDVYRFFVQAMIDGEVEDLRAASTHGGDDEEEEHPAPRPETLRAPKTTEAPAPAPVPPAVAVAAAATPAPRPVPETEPPTSKPETKGPASVPETGAPTSTPAVADTRGPASAPAVAETETPTSAPTGAPTEGPTSAPTVVAETKAPSPKPSGSPSPKPSSEAPSPKPSGAPSPKRSEAPSPKPSEAPSPKPSEAPNPKPSEAPSPKPRGPSPTEESPVAAAGAEPQPFPT